MKGTKSPKKPKDPDYEDNLYICMQDATQKRKNILHGIKNALIMQEEHEKVLELRKNKILIANEIKKLLEEVNKKYQKLRKDLPNVKNVISYTEKEITELESQISTLKQEKRVNERDINLEESIDEDLKSSNHALKKIAHTKIRKFNTKKPHSDNTGKNHHKEENPKFIVKRKEASKLDRIKNNLKVIESKLKNI